MGETPQQIYFLAIVVVGLGLTTFFSSAGSLPQTSIAKRLLFISSKITKVQKAFQSDFATP